MSEMIFYAWVREGLIFLTFLAICATLLQKRYRNPTTNRIGFAFFVGILLLHAALLLLDMPSLQILGLLPLTAYLPMIVCLHILSKSTFFQTASIWSLGLVGYFISQFSVKLLRRPALLYFSYPLNEIFILAVVVLIAAALLLFLHRYVKKLFSQYILAQNTGWMSLWLPLVALLSLFSYFFNSTGDPVVFSLLFFMALSIFFLQFQVLRFTDEALFLRKTENEYERQMERQQHDYEEICKKLEMGRAYRHDMRHHFAALTGSLALGNTEEALAYIQSLSNQFDQVTWKIHCQNLMINAVISFYGELAKNAGCQMTTQVAIPKETIFEDMDLCSIFSNALENAVHACEKIPDGGSRTIAAAAFWDENKLIISVKNSCAEQFSFDEHGFPIVPKKEGHGIGLKSMEAISRKYEGLFLCSQQADIFSVKVALFKPKDTSPDKKIRSMQFGKKAFTTLCLFLFAFAGSAPVLVDALQNVPVIGTVIEFFDLKKYSLRWGDTAFEATVPVIESNQPVEDVNAQLEAYVQQLRQTFINHVAVKYQGYTGMDSTYVVLNNSDTFISIVFETTLNVGGSENIKRIFTLNKETAQLVSLEDFCGKGAPYVEALSREILRQMQAQVDAGTADFFVPGGIWSDDECFKAIDPDQGFYINSQGALVLVFDEYTVAPGSMGNPEFVIPAEVLAAM